MGHLTAIRRRLQQVDDAACHWGIDWFVLPNPIYGEWEKLLGDDPLAAMRRPGSSRRGRIDSRSAA